MGDPAAQTHETLDNIEALIGEPNLARHGLPGLGSSLANLGLVRVYIKRQEDYAQIRAACQERLGEVPTVYAIADVCRPELLVEIEGIAFSRQVPRAEPDGGGWRSKDAALAATGRRTPPRDPRRFCPVSFAQKGIMGYTSQLVGGAVQQPGFELRG